MVDSAQEATGIFRGENDHHPSKNRRIIWLLAALLVVACLVFAIAQS